MLLNIPAVLLLPTPALHDFYRKKNRQENLQLALVDFCCDAVMKLEISAWLHTNCVIEVCGGLC